jgi:aspartyl-tRNA(Asn)/glutamyl-tRNA(Gln) amidotransferase subunit A
MTWSVRDAAAFLDIIAQPDSRDWYALPEPNVRFAGEIDKRRGRSAHRLLRALGGHAPEREICERVDAAVECLETLGAKSRSSMRAFPIKADLFRKIWATGIASSLSTYPKESRAVMDPAMVALGRMGPLRSITWTISRLSMRAGNSARA